jgi:hypothetical protein
MERQEAEKIASEERISSFLLPEIQEEKIGIGFALWMEKPESNFRVFNPNN